MSVMAASLAQVLGPSQERGETVPRHCSRHQVLVERPQGRPAGSPGPALWIPTSTVCQGTAAGWITGDAKAKVPVETS